MKREKQNESQVKKLKLEKMVIAKLKNNQTHTIYGGTGKVANSDVGCDSLGGRTCSGDPNHK
jgi:hypothetical protein